MLNVAVSVLQCGVKSGDTVLTPTLMPGTGPTATTDSSRNSSSSSNSSSNANRSNSDDQSSDNADARGRLVLSAACGLQHTLLVTADGGVLACGRNQLGQCGLNPQLVQ